jgi:hypothetical protein
MSTKTAKIRVFETGADRDTAEGKLDFNGFLSPLAMEAFATYMHFNRLLPDGTLRASDHWQLGIPEDVYRKSAWRLWFDIWSFLRGNEIRENIVRALCGLMFNIQGILHERLEADPGLLDLCRQQMEQKREARLASSNRADKR